MAFGLNRVELIGRLGADAEIVTLSNGTRIAKLRVATDESYVSKQSGERVDAQEWHQVVTFQQGLVAMFEKHGRKGRLVFVEGKLQTRRWRKEGEETDRFSTEIMVIPGSQVSFLDKPGTAAAGASADPTPAPASDDLPSLDESYPMAA
ncbi:MAG: single-stranded DNA-binding protein [Deltaproteobacteria bacterium]|nr:single-stranded DNA-binding protein [Deltaproteobacteria bacterium]